MRLAGAIGSVVLCLATAAGAQLVPPSESGGVTVPPVEPEYVVSTVVPLNTSAGLLPEGPVGPGPVGSDMPAPPADPGKPGTEADPTPEGPGAEAPAQPTPPVPPVAEPVAPSVEPVSVQGTPREAPAPVATEAVDPAPVALSAPPETAVAPSSAGGPMPAAQPPGWLASWSVVEPEPAPTPMEAPPVLSFTLASWSLPEASPEPAASEASAAAPAAVGPSAPAAAEPIEPEPLLASSSYAPWAPGGSAGGSKADAHAVLVPVAAATVVAASLVPLARWVLGPFLLSRIPREDLLRQATRARIHDFVVSNPGAHLSEIRRALGMSKGPTSYHLQVLVAAGIVVKVENPPYSSYFANGASEGVRAAARALRVPKARSLLAQVLERPGLDVQTLVDGSPMARSMVYYHLNRLAEVGLVEFQGGVRNRALNPTQLAQHFAGTVGAEQVAVDLVAPQPARALPA